MIEVRALADGRLRLEGDLMVYGDTAAIYPGMRERWEPGSIRLSADAILNRQHDRGRPLARVPDTLSIADSPERARLVATMPATADACDVHSLVSAGILQGLSVEFAAERERLEGEVRVIEAAVVVGAAVVDVPAYRLATVEARAGEIGTGRPRRRNFFL